MKLTATKIRECAAWVEQNGLYPQRCGAAVKTFCEAMDISDTCYRRWLEKVDFVDAIKKANQVFSQKSVIEAVNSLKKRAMGFEFKKVTREGGPQMVTEYDSVGRKTKTYPSDKIVTKKMKEETVYVVPDTAAIIFLLTNLDPDNWKNKQDTSTDLNVEFEEEPVIVFSDSPAKEQKQE